jgi:transposase
MLPSVYGKWQTLYRRFRRWEEKEIWGGLFEQATFGADLTEVMLDGTVVRSHACASGYIKGGNEEQGLGRSKGGFTTKIHALVDALGNPLRLVITGGNRHEIIKAEELIHGIENSFIIADKAFDSLAFRKVIEQQNCTAVIPPRKSRKEKFEYDKDLYKERHLIECFFSKLKQYRRVFSRFDKRKASFQAFLDLASALISIR